LKINSFFSGGEPKVRIIKIDKSKIALPKKRGCLGLFFLEIFHLGHVPRCFERWLIALGLYSSSSPKSQTPIYFRNGEYKMKFSIMLTIVGAVISIWCPTGHADRLYTWEDDNGVTHISKEPPPQKTKLIDIMDYTVSPAQKNQATSKQLSNEGESSKLQRSGTQKRRKASGATGTTEEVDEDVYYDSDGGRYTRRAIRHEIREKLENRRENVRPATRQRRQFRRRE
jgi:hypothetical protein